MIFKIPTFKPFLGSDIRQIVSMNNKVKLYCATDLINLYKDNCFWGSKTPANLSLWLRSKHVKNRLYELLVEHRIKRPVIYRTDSGRLSLTWLHIKLFTDLIFHIDPKFDLDKKNWIFRDLIQFTKMHGKSSAELMRLQLLSKCSNKSKFSKILKQIDDKLKLRCGVKDWFNATEDQLDKKEFLEKKLTLFSTAFSSKNQNIAIEFALDYVHPSGDLKIFGETFDTEDYFPPDENLKLDPSLNKTFNGIVSCLKCF